MSDGHPVVLSIGSTLSTENPLKRITRKNLLLLQLPTHGNRMERMWSLHERVPLAV
jgi:hypothetical protein